MAQTMLNIDMYLEDTLAPGTYGYLPPLRFQPGFGYVPLGFNIGGSEARPVREKRPSQNGEFDFTKNYGGKAVVINVAIAPEAMDTAKTDEELETELLKWMNPSKRVYIYYRRKGSLNYRRALVTPQPPSLGLNLVTNEDFDTMSLAFRASDGIFESDQLFETVLEPGGTGLGRAYSLTFPRTYPASPVVGSQTVFNAGSTDSYPVVRIFGQALQPRIENVTSGKVLEFQSTYDLLAGEFLLIDFKEGTVMLNGDPAQSQSRYDKLNLAVSEWWSLAPGDNLIRYYPLSYTAPSKAFINWRSSFL